MRQNYSGVGSWQDCENRLPKNNVYAFGLTNNRLQAAPQTRTTRPNIRGWEISIIENENTGLDLCDGYTIADYEFGELQSGQSLLMDGVAKPANRVKLQIGLNPMREVLITETLINPIRLCARFSS